MYRYIGKAKRPCDKCQLEKDCFVFDTKKGTKYFCQDCLSNNKELIEYRKAMRKK